MNTRLLGVFAKQPRAGNAKTRLAAATSPAWALRVAQAFLEDSLERVAPVHADAAIVYAPADAHAFFAPLAGERFAQWPQADGDLGQRLRQFFAAARQRGYSRIVVIGTDSPTLPVAWVEQAFALLEKNDVVMVPAFDGGYCLLGIGAREFDLFDGVPWSTSGVLNATLARVRAADARLALLPPWYDVDTVDDWNMLCGHVRAMRHAGMDPAAPRTERLVGETRDGALFQEVST